MKQESTGSLLSTVFVDYDNVYLSLKRKNEQAATRFAKNAGAWLSAIASGELITSTNGVPLTTPRRIVMNRCYGNPVPRRNASDNATDMNSFPFVRHHYLRAGFEVIDCPPLTAQLKNSADIRMVMDVRDYLLHDTYFDEFIILSGDADFTPVLHRLRAHARRTVIYANDYTAAPYRAISDGEIREADLINLLVGGEAGASDGSNIETDAPKKGLPSPEMLSQTRSRIINEVLATVRSSNEPVPLEALADRAVRVLGHENTVGTAWGGVGSFRDLLLGGLPEAVKLSNEAPYYVFDTARQLEQNPQSASAPAKTPECQAVGAPAPAPTPAAAPKATAAATQPSAGPIVNDTAQASPATAPASATQVAPDAAPTQNAPTSEAPAAQHLPQPAHTDDSREPIVENAHLAAPDQSKPSDTPAHVATPTAPHGQHSTPQQPAQAPAAASAPGGAAPSAPKDSAAAIQQSIARIHEACQAPPLSPPEYRVLFHVMAEEIKNNGLTGARTLVNIVSAAQKYGVNLRRDDARFILEIVSEADPWFEQGASAPLFASRFRNFVVARCRGQGLNLSASELDLIDAWFSGAPQQGGPEPGAQQPTPQQQPAQTAVNTGAPQGQPVQAARQPMGQDARPQSVASAAQPQPAPTQQAAPQRQAVAPAPGSLGAVVPSQASATHANAPAAANHDPFGGAPAAQQQAPNDIMHDEEEFPRIVRSRARG